MSAPKSVNKPIRISQSDGRAPFSEAEEFCRFFQKSIIPTIKLCLYLMLFCCNICNQFYSFFQCVCMCVCVCKNLPMLFKRWRWFSSYRIIFSDLLDFFLLPSFWLLLRLAYLQRLFLLINQDWLLAEGGKNISSLKPFLITDTNKDPVK